MNPLARERRSRDTRPQPAWRPPATPCKAAQPPPPPAMKRLALLLPLLALAAAPARAEDPATNAPARFPGDGFELRAYQDAVLSIPPEIFSIPNEGRHPDAPEGGAFRASCNAFLVIEGDRRILVDAGNGSPRGTLLAQLRADGIDPATVTDVLLTHEHRDHVGGLFRADGAPAFPNAMLHMWWPTNVAGRAAFEARHAAFRLDLFADAASATNLPAGFAAEPAPGHTPQHCFYRKGGMLFVGDVFHAVDLQVPHPEFCAKWDQTPAAAIAVRKALIERVRTNIPKPRAGMVTFFTTTPIPRTPFFLCGAHIPFPGIVSLIRIPQPCTGEAPSWDVPEPGTPVPPGPNAPAPDKDGVRIEVRRRTPPDRAAPAPHAESADGAKEPAP